MNTLVNGVCAFIHSQQIGQVILLTESTVSNNTITQYTCFAHSHSPEIARPRSAPAISLSLALYALCALVSLWLLQLYRYLSTQVNSLNTAALSQI